MARTLLNFRSVFIGSALVVGLSVWGCGGGDNSGAAGDSGDDNGGSSNGGSSRGGSSNGGSSNAGESNGGSSNGGSSNGGSTSVGGSGGSAGADWCADGACICSNGIDDDDDGLVDGLDPECTGPLDNDEGSFSTGIPGDNRDPKWQDCFFDGNSGAGDDQCRYATECLLGTLEQDDPDCQLSQACIDFCRRLTPNGCDCFGCCTIGEGDDAVDVMIGNTCSLDNIDDEAACPRCTKTTQCDNGCGECELCPGKTVEDLPDSCTPPPPDGGTYDGGVPPPPNTCDNGEIVCSEDIPCPGELFCSLGCCIEIVR